jgi:translation initiation factor 3 subunit B
VWDVASGRLLRSFFMEPSISDKKNGKMDWPVFKWSFDGKYLAKMVPGDEGVLQVYETPGMGLLDKKSIKVFLELLS